ncbi:DUF2147 domain-containing protein [Flavihumibacter sp. R14]|nr:DUF2147 domain-containing protein [Flavihumibacter soli]
MFRKKLLSILFIMHFGIAAFSQNKDAILGKWLNASGEGHIMIYRSGDKYSGKLVWLKNPENDKGQLKRDTRNPNPQQRTRPLMGIQILQNFVYLGDGVWEDGSIYDPKTGKTYSCKISMVDNNKLNIRGYVGVSLLGRTEAWQRVN